MKGRSDKMSLQQLLEHSEAVCEMAAEAPWFVSPPPCESPPLATTVSEISGAAARVLDSVERQVSEAVASKVFDAIDANGDGVISRREFQAAYGASGGIPPPQSAHAATSRMRDAIIVPSVRQSTATVTKRPAKVKARRSSSQPRTRPKGKAGQSATRSKSSASVASSKSSTSVVNSAPSMRPAQAAMSPSSHIMAKLQQAHERSIGMGVQSLQRKREKSEKNLSKYTEKVKSLSMR